MGRIPFTVVACLSALAWLAPTARADDAAAIRDAVAAWTTPEPGSTTTPTRAPRMERRSMRRGWGLELRTAALRQFETDIDGGGRFQVSRLFTQANVSYSPRPGMPLSVSFGYRLDAYDFDGTARGAFPARPWSDVHTVSIGVPLFVPISDRWFVIGVPVIRTTVEDGASWDDGITGGGFVGASYRVNDRLRIGPGIGVLTNIEDDPSIFPVLIVDWRITRTLGLKTGRGLGATQGPGVFLEWEPNRRWMLSLGGRFDRLRFRLDDHGAAPGGVGEESAFATVLAARFRPSRRLELSMSVGVTFLGELRLEDRRGNRLVREDYDTAAFLGLGFTLTL